VLSVAFSPDGERVVTASVDHDVRVWGVASGAAINVFPIAYAVVRDARYSPDGRWIVVAGPRTVPVLRADTGKQLLLLRGFDDVVTAVDFDATGGRVVAAGADGAVRLHRCDLCGGFDDLVALARARLDRLEPRSP
jgi:WD40 repeat protein